MKQEITRGQFNELDTFDKDKVCNWSLEKDYGVRLDPNNIYAACLTIGQMIEFLNEEYSNEIDIKYCPEVVFDEYDSDGPQWVVTINRAQFHTAEELCDALFKCVKDTLNGIDLSKEIKKEPSIGIPCSVGNEKTYIN